VIALKCPLLIVKRGTEIFLLIELVPFAFSVQILVKEAERRHIGVSKLAQLLLLVFTLHIWQLPGLARLKVAHYSISFLFF